MAQFPKPVLPRPSNSTGPPTPPSGFHTPANSGTVLIPTGGLPVPPPPAGAGSNIHRGRLARLLRRGDDYDLLRSVW